MLHVGSEAPFALIYWPDEERVSIVKTQDIHDYSSVLGDGDTVLVKFGGQTFSGILKVKGTIPEVRKAEADYLRSSDLKEKCPATQPRALDDHKSSAHTLTGDGAPSRKRSRKHTRKAPDNVPPESAAKRRKTSDKCQRGTIIVVDQHEKVKASEETVMHDVNEKAQEEKLKALEQTNDGKGQEDEEALYPSVTSIKEGSWCKPGMVTPDEDSEAFYKHLTPQEEEEALYNLFTAEDQDTLYPPVTTAEEGELNKPVTVTAYEDSKALCKPLTQEEEEALYNLWSPDLEDPLHEPWQQTVPSALGGNQEDQERKLQRLEDMVQTLANKCADLYQRIEVLEAANGLAGFAMDPWQATQHPLPAVSETHCQDIPSVALSDPDDTPPEPGTPIQPISAPTANSEEALTSIDAVLQKYPKLCNQRNVSRLAVKLARESTFGLQVMRESTPHGTLTLKKLPANKLNTIKTTIRTFFPPSDNAVAEFELTWKACVESIAQACKHERRKLNQLTKKTSS